MITSVKKCSKNWQWTDGCPFENQIIDKIEAVRTLNTIYEDIALRADPISLHIMKNRIVSCIPQMNDAVHRVDCMFKLACIVHHLKIHAINSPRNALLIQPRPCTRYLREFFSKLQCELELVRSGSVDHNLVRTYWKNTCGHDHRYHVNSWKLKKVFSVRNKLQEASFKKLHNRKILWHGNRNNKWIQILRSGLQVQTVSAGNRGIYFADRASKSLGFTTKLASSDEHNALILLCEVSLGRIHESSHMTATQFTQSTCDSLLMRGRQYADPKLNVVDRFGAEWPLGPSMLEPSNSMMESEYVIFDGNQAKMRYLLWLHVG
uniref:Poly [ADP-ribose] polymerase n=1 Tax=Albugo laibachii Nc14 TaxID=890382 RepID=F0WC47_9STRA|nr:PREDICTED: similar to poly(ADPribose) polymerase pu [Albugo laibachii Nc14]CCA25204.1 PREDICTED: similar to poly(ADPribose) polymerase pu [Albugo laibachii Nc14]|eukprot:CCA25204.1 PREDICTED: similar to poly(ADPribose) polymerase pu [Albugo laibachii Nc14]